MYRKSAAPSSGTTSTPQRARNEQSSRRSDWCTVLVCLLFHTFLPAAAAQDVANPNLVIPYAPDQPALRAGQVFVRHDEFLKLYQQANPGDLNGPSINPLGSTVVATFLKSGALTPVDGQKQTLSFDSRFVVSCDSDTAISVQLPLGPVAVRSVTVDGKEGSIRPLIVGAQTTEIQNFASQQIQATRQAPAPTTEGSAYSVEVAGKGLHVVDVKFDIAALVEGELGRADLPLRSAAAGTLEWTLPAEGLDAIIHGRTNTFRREGRIVTVPIAQLSTIRLQWLPTVQKVAGDVVLHSSTASTLSVQDSGMTLRTTVSATVRQGEISELDVTIPEGYSVQSVTGEDVAGWTAQSTDATRSVRLQLRRAVNDITKVTMQLYSNAPTAEALASLPVPISMVRGASRDLGTVILKTGSQFQVRSDALSAVTQINPNEAQAPDGDELPGRPMLAWRYTRHPASVTVKVTPTADELIADSMHAVRMEEQRQLWSSRMTLRVNGAARSRIDIAVPKSYLALDVTATGLKDWYFSDAIDGDSANADLRILSIQLTDARTGQLQIAIQGQMNRDADRTLLKLQPPVIMSATKATSELAVWLDAASESAGVESGVGNGGGWTVKSAVSAHANFREVCESAPSLAFQSNTPQPSSLAVKLRQAVSTLIGESVTVTNVTETAIEITLALNWQVARAAADQFAVELPTGVASMMTFEVPGQRRVTKEDIGNGKTRVTLQLQQPVTDRLFVLGTASLPLPADRVIRSEVPGIVVPQGAPSTLSAQGHFWVLVNQSNGLLQPSAEQPEDKLSPDQITTQIPPQLLQQAVAVVKLRPETAVWNLVYPEQHQVAPAVVNLATHTTVIADDGSWRSRHQLQVTNESRQFLPVILPKGSRLMYCLVQDRPSRVVIRGEGDAQRHLIPIPQSGAVASGFSVEFALAGRFEVSASEIRKDWKSHRMLIPVPTFPEFREDAEFGISVSRNRWSVYVPQSWRASPVDDPAVTNVVRGEELQMLDFSVSCVVDETESLLKAAKSTRGDFLRRKLQAEVQNKLNSLNAIRGNSAVVEQQRGETLARLNEVNADFFGESGAQQQATPQPLVSEPVFGNFFLHENDLNQNKTNLSNNSLFFSFNGRGGSAQNRTLGEQQAETRAETEFRFGINLIDDVESMSPEESEKLNEAKPGDAKVKGNSSEAGRRFGKPAKKSEATKDALAADSELSKSNRGSQSQLIQQRGDKVILGRELKQTWGMDLPGNSDLGLLSGGIAAAQEQALPQVNAIQLYATQNQAAPARAATSTGLLSLRFDVPTDGQRIDFLRVGGNPQLSLDVRSSEAVSKGTGLIWLAVCCFGGISLFGPGRGGRVLVFCLRLFLILSVSGMLAWLFMSGNVKSLGLIVCVAGAIGVAITTATMKLRRTA